MGLNAPGVFGLILRPIRMIACQQLIQDQSAGEDVRMEPWHRSAHQVFGRPVIVRANITLESVPRRSLVRKQRKVHVDELKLEAGADRRILDEVRICRLQIGMDNFGFVQGRNPRP